MRSVMIDLETMGTSSRAAIVQIAAVEFDDTDFRDDLGGFLKVNVDLQSSLDKGLEVDGGAVKFWLNQPKKNFLEGEILDLEEALCWLCVRFKWKEVEHVWSHSTFDMPILNSAYKACGIKLPFNFRSCLDLGTVFQMANLEKGEWLDSDGTKHDALDDCRFQIRRLKEAMEILKK